MARPTTEKKDKTVKLRISEEMYEELLRRGDNVSETIRGMIRNVPQKVADNSVPHIDELQKRCVDEAEEYFKNGEYKEIKIVTNAYGIECERAVDNVPQKNGYEIPYAIYHDIDQMCGFFGIGIDDFFVELCKSMNAGTISYDKGVFRGKTDIDVERFMESCHRANKDAQKMINECAQMIERSRI